MVRLDYPPVVLALIRNQIGCLLVSQRALNSPLAPGKWQIPEGKIESGESHLSVLKREVKEETDLDIKSIGNSVFRYSDTENKFEIYFYEVKSQGEYQSSRAKQTEFGMNLS